MSVEVGLLFIFFSLLFFVLLPIKAWPFSLPL